MFEHLRWRRCLQGTAVTATLLFAMTASATGQALKPAVKTLAGATNSVTACGAVSAIRVGYTVQAGNIVAVTLSNIPASCFTGLLSLTLSQGVTDVGHAGPTAIVASTLTVIPHLLTTAAIFPTAARLSIVGP